MDAEPANVPSDGPEGSAPTPQPAPPPPTAPPAPSQPQLQPPVFFLPPPVAPPPPPRALPVASSGAHRDGRKPGAIVAFVVAAVVFITAFGLGHNSGIGSSGSTNNATTDPSAIVSSDDNGSTDTSGISDAVSPGVVNINTTLAGGGEAAGTGMVLTSDGQVLTNNHVIDGATDIQVEINGNGTMKSAKVLGYDAADDVALIKIKNVSNLKTVTLGDSSRVSVNDAVVAIGNALGKGGSPAVTSGFVAALNQTITAGDAAGGSSETLRGMIQINAVIQPGDSGGPLLNTNSQVIGINTAAASAGGFRQSSSNVAFAIPINNARSIADQIAAGKASSSIHIGERGIIGVSVQSDAAQSAPLGRPSSGSTTTGSGARVIAVEDGSPAAGAGIKAGDTLTAVNDTTVRSSTELNVAMSPYHPGDKISISWTDSSGQKQTQTITLMLGPPA